MSLDVSEGTDPRQWGSTPTEFQIGGVSVWSSHDLVSQPNRWGVVQAGFPDGPCTVEIDPLVAGHLPLPERAIGFVDRCHRPVAAPVAGEQGRIAIELGRILGRRLEQIPGVVIAFRPFARTVAVITPAEPAAVIERCAARGVIGIRALPGVGGAIALSAQPSMTEDDLAALVRVIREALDT